MKKTLSFLVLASVVFVSWSFSNKPGAISQNVSPVQSQSGNPFSFFNAHRQGHKSIGLMWRIDKSDNVLDFQIQRSYDGEYFNIIADISCDANTKFTWKDNNVFPGYIYYRLAANLMDGTTFYSEVEIVHVVRK